MSHISILDNVNEKRKNGDRLKTQNPKEISGLNKICDDGMGCYKDFIATYLGRPA